MRTQDYYKKVLLAVKGKYTLSTKFNKLYDLYMSSVGYDPHLTDLLSSYLNYLDRMVRYQSSKQFGNYNTMLLNSKPVLNDLISYCTNMHESIVKSEKPAWMLEALRNGWRPPEN